MSLPLIVTLFAIGGASVAADQSEETEMSVTGIGKAQLVACLPEKLAKWQGYRPRQPGPNPDIIDYDQRDMSPAYRLTLVDIPDGIGLRVVHYVPTEPLAKALRDCVSDAAKAQAK